MHWGDALAGRLVPRRTRFFADGWGDAALVERLERERGATGVPELRDVALGAERPEGALSVVEGHFPSPAADAWPLPEASRVARFQLVLPNGAGPRPPVCVLLAASGDEGFGMRRFLAAGLLRRGIGALLLENPYYGARRPPAQVGPALRTVADMLLMFRATSLEAVGLLAWLRARGHAQVGVSGYSMGGSLAAFSAALYPEPVAVVPLAAADSAAPVFTEGVLSRLPAWDVLAREAGCTEGAARTRLAEVLGAAATTRLPPLANPSRALLVAASADGFVPAAATQRLHAHWQGSQLWTVPGGHVSAFVTGRARMGRAVWEAFARAAVGGGASPR